MEPGGPRVPLIRRGAEGLGSELVPDGCRAEDAGGVVAERLVVGVADPDRRCQAGGEADRPVVLEVVGRASLGRDVASGERQVAVTAERHAAVAVVRHDGRDDEGDRGIDGAVLILRRIPREYLVSEPVLYLPAPP